MLFLSNFQQIKKLDKGCFRFKRWSTKFSERTYCSIFGIARLHLARRWRLNSIIHASERLHSALLLILPASTVIFKGLRSYQKSYSSGSVVPALPTIRRLGQHIGMKSLKLCGHATARRGINATSDIWSRRFFWECLDSPPPKNAVDMKISLGTNVKEWSAVLRG